MIVFFDVDGTLITFEDKPRHEVIQLLRTIYSLDVDIVVWSGGGKEYAQRWVDRLGLDQYVREVATKEKSVYDVAPAHKVLLTVDDEDADFGVPNMKV